MQGVSARPCARPPETIDGEPPHIRRRTLDRRGFFGLALVGVLGPCPGAGAGPPTPRWREFPFGQKLDMAVVDAVVGTDPAQLLAAIGRHGVDVRIVRSATADRPPNPLLVTVPAASAELIRRAEFLDTYEGRVILRGNPYCDVPRDTLLIRDTASTYTLLHEFVQSLLRPIEECRDDEDIELRFAVEFRRMTLYQRHLYDDPFRLLDPLWRRDILDAQAAVARLLYRRIQIGQSQEAIVEQVLRGAIGEFSPYQEAARRAQGLGYGERMIDNAIDLFNDIDGAVVFVQDTVRNLREELRAGRIELSDRQRLTEADVHATDAAGRDIASALARVRAEILVLKRFYAG